MTYRRLTALLLALAAPPALAAKESSARKPPARAGAAARAPKGAKARPAFQAFAYVKAPGGAVSKVSLLSKASENVAIARVDGEPITIRELNDALAATHESRPGDEHAAGHDVRPVVDRLVTMRLFVAEAREMGLDQQPGYRKAVSDFEEQQLRSLTELRATRGIRPDAMEVEQHYKDAIRQWKVRSLLFPKKEDATAFRAAVAAGKPFAALAKDAIATKKATGNDAADWAPRTSLLPAVAEAVEKITLAPAYTDAIPVKGGFAVVAVEALRYPDDPKARAAAEEASVERQRLARLEQHRVAIEKKYAHTDRKLWKSLDFEAAKPGFAALAKDRRPIVTIQGEPPVTVADVAEEMQHWFFHGVDEPLKEKKLDAAKDAVLHKLLTRRLYLHDGRALGIPLSAAYRKAVADYEDSVLFGSYVQKVIVPDIKVTEDEGKTYYAKHRPEFTFPAFYKLEALVFSTPKAAGAAAKKLAAGTDFGFLRANADGQVKPDDRALALDGQTFSANALPPELVQALAGAKRDDVRPFTTAGQGYLVHVLDVTAPREQSYADVRATIGKKLAADKLTQAVNAVAAKLRPGHHVAVYLERVGN